jgi:5'-3' exonuclease
MKKELVIDYSNVIFRTINMAYINGRPSESKKKRYRDDWSNYESEPLVTQTTDEIHDFWRHMTLNSILATIKREKPDEVTIVYDARGGYWRHDVYSEYKGQRREDRSNSIVDFDLFFPVADEFKKEFMEAYPNFKHLEVEKCEADDIAAVIAQKHSTDKEIILITNDKDYIQLLQYPNVRLYNPVDKKEVVSTNPTKDLSLKVLTGDKSDNIPAIKPRTGIKTAEKILLKGVTQFIEEQDDSKAVEKAYNRNRTLIDLTHIPPKYVDKINNTYVNYKTKEFNFNDNMKFLQKNKLSKLTSDLTLYHCTMLSKIK